MLKRREVFVNRKKLRFSYKASVKGSEKGSDRLCLERTSARVGSSVERYHLYAYGYEHDDVPTFRLVLRGWLRF